MIKNLAKRLAWLLLKNNPQRQRYLAKAEYKLARWLHMLVFVLLLLGLSLLFGLDWRRIAVFMAVMGMRGVAGGVHAKGRVRCFVYSLATYLLCYGCASLLPWWPLGLCLLCGTTAVLFAMAPIVHRNLRSSEENNAILCRLLKKWLFTVFGALLMLLALYPKAPLVYMGINCMVSIAISVILANINKGKGEYIRC